MQYRAAALSITAIAIIAAAPSHAVFRTAETGSAALPAVAIAIASDVYVERTDDTTRVLQPASTLRRGDRVVTIVNWKRTAAGNASHFTVTNPLPRKLQFQGSASGTEEVSVDGGQTWGRIGLLHLGNRLATPEDVTHVRWRIATPATSGRIAYSAIVR